MHCWFWRGFVTVCLSGELSIVQQTAQNWSREGRCCRLETDWWFVFGLFVSLWLVRSLGRHLEQGIVDRHIKLDLFDSYLVHGLPFYFCLHREWEQDPVDRLVITDVLIHFDLPAR